MIIAAIILASFTRGFATCSLIVLKDLKKWK